MVTEMENLAYLGRYEEALRLEKPARAALEPANDTRYLTLIEASLGNLYYRLRRFSESLEHYERARTAKPDADAAAAIGIGRAHVLTEMNRFDEAIEAFQATRENCEQRGLSVWAGIADRGIANIYIQRGDSSLALQMLDQIRQKHEAANDARRMALCDIERSEIYLKLNLFQDASSVAGRAFEIFQNLSNRYESALALKLQGIAEFELMHNAEARSAFRRARELFAEETGNEISVAAVDLWLAQLLLRQHQFAEAAELAYRSAEVFEKQGAPIRAADARVLSAQSLQRMQQIPAAIADAQWALQKLEGFHAPWVSYRALNTLGKLRELEGAKEEAEALYLRAIGELEVLRGNIKLDEFRMSFGKDKYQAYENMVSIKLGRGDARAAFEFVERSKSRTLIDQMERSVETAWDAGAGESPRFQRIRKIRAELNILYSRLNEIGTTGRAVASDTTTRTEIAKREQEFVELLREAGSEKPGWATLHTMPSPGVEDVQKMLEPDELLVEYYAVGDSFQAFVIGREKFHAFPDLAVAAEIRASIRGLNFQLSKFHLQPNYLSKHASLLLAAVRHHLQNLHAKLVAPISQLFEGARRLIIVPHQMLHYVPFHALFDGEKYLIDKYAVSYSASASVLRICRSRKPSGGSSRDLILAVADSLTPHINDEVEALRKLLPDADVFVGDRGQ